MALTSSQISSKLFKKSLGAGETLVTRQFFEEPRLGRELVLYDQIWSQSNLIPNTAPVLSPGASAGVVQYFQLDSLSHVSGAVNLSYFSANLIDSIPFNYGDGTYNYQLFKNDGVTPISFGEGDWIIDNTAGLLTFYGTLPSGVSSALPPKVSFYKYVGTKGFGSGSGIGTIIGVTAGSGLTGGGTAGFISLDINLKVNSGLTFSGDDIIIWDRISGTGLSFSDGVISVNVNDDSLEIVNDILRLKNTITGDRTFIDSLTVGGNLTVNGTVSYINTENVYIEDNILTLNATWSSGSPILDAGIEVLRGASQAAVLKWIEGQDLWVLGVSNSTSAIITEAGAGLTKSGNVLSTNFTSIAGSGLTSNGSGLDILIGNGLSIINDYVYLGGTLSQETTINANNFNFSINAAENIIFTSSTFDVMAEGFISLDAGFGSVQIAGDDGVDLISLNGDISLTAIYNLLINATSSNITVGDGRGLVYSSDYSNTFVTHSLITKKYVDTATASIWSAIDSIGSDYITGITAGQGLTGGGTAGFVNLEVNTGLGLTISDDKVSMYWTGTQSGLTFSNNGVGVNVDNSTIAINNDGKLSVVAGASIPVYEKKLSLNTSGDNSTTGFTLSFVPNDYSRIEVFVNGQIQYVGDGISTGVDCYFWNGASVLFLNQLQIGSELLWNSSSSGFNLTSVDTIYVVYEK